MFNRSKNRIILSIMGSLILLFAITLSVIMIASYREIRQQSAEMLERYVELYALGQRPESPDPPEQMPGGTDPAGPVPDGMNVPGSGPKPGEPPIDQRPGYQLSTFYSVTMAEDGSVLSVDNGERAIYSEEELAEIAKELLAEGRSSGRKSNLSYSISRRPGYTLVAFIDNTVTESSLNTLLHNVLIIGGAAIVVLFFISLQLSKRIIKPLEENDRRQKQFISDASHELKTPVSVIDANAEMLSRELGENEWLSNIRYENERMGGLVKQLLELSRAENAEMTMEQVDLSRLVTGEVLAFESLAFDRGKTLRSDIEEDILITGNRTQLSQLVSVLLDNAVRHSIGPEIDVSLKHHGHMAVLSVANEADEIPAEKQEHLFERFYRVDEARSSDDQHYGLGLSIAKAVAERHGGSIGVSCGEGKVSFSVYIPQKN